MDDWTQSQKFMNKFLNNLILQGYFCRFPTSEIWQARVEDK